MHQIPKHALCNISVYLVNRFVFKGAFSNRVTIRPLLPRHVLSGISKLPEISRVWLCFTVVFILAKGNN